MAQTNTAERFGWSVSDWARSTGISRSSTFELIAAEQVQSVKFGAKRLIVTHPREFLASLATGTR